MPPHRWTDETRDASCYYGNNVAGAAGGASSDADDDDTEADDERQAFCSGDRPLIRGRPNPKIRNSEKKNNIYSN